jgi:glucose-6-phosphate 1-dehydrogenase
VWNQFSEGTRFVRGEFDDDAAFERLAATLDEQRSPQG